MNTQIDCEKTKGCDKISRAYCENFNALQPLFVTDSNIAVLGNIQIKLDNMDVFDRATLGLYIGKFVEQEINSSIVQLMRYAICIDMPEFYCKRDPRFRQDEVKRGNKSIRLNRQADPSKSDSLATIPAGDAYYALEVLKEESDVFEDYKWLYEREFLDAWRKLFGFRNNVAHIGHLITQKELEEAYGWFEVFLKYMPHIRALKVALAPDGMFDDNETVSVTKENNELKDVIKNKPLPTPELYSGMYDMMYGYNQATPDALNEINHNLEEYDWFTQVFESQNGKKGMRHVDGKILVPAIYDEYGFTYNCLDTHFSVIPACKCGKVGLVKCDGSGDPVTEFIYDRIETIPWRQNVFAYYKGGSLSYGLLLKDGRELCPCIIDMNYEPSQTCMIFKSGDYYGLYDLNEKVVMPMFEEIEVDEPTDPMVFTLNGIKGYLDNELKFVPKYEIDAIEDENERYDKLLEFLPSQYDV